MKCLVKGCKNQKGQGGFIGEICSPCYDILVSGKIKPSNAWFVKLIEGNTMNIKHTENAFNDLNEMWREEMERMEEALADSQAIIEQMKTDLETLIQSWKGQDHDK